MGSEMCIRDRVKDITFIASVFTGCLASFNITPGGKKKKEEKTEGGKGVANSSENVQTIRIVQEPLKIIGVKEVDPKTKT